MELFLQLPLKQSLTIIWLNKCSFTNISYDSYLIQQQGKSLSKIIIEILLICKTNRHTVRQADALTDRFIDRQMDGHMKGGDTSC